MESPLTFLAIFSLLLLGSAEARKNPEDWSNGLATMNEKQKPMVESAYQEAQENYPIEASQADSRVDDQTSTLSIAIGKNCGKAKVGTVEERGATKEGYDRALEETVHEKEEDDGALEETVHEKEDSDSVYLDEDSSSQKKFWFLLDPRTDATIYHE